MASVIRGSDGFDSATTVINQGTAVATTSGTAIDFTGIPAGVKRIIVMFNEVSTNSTSNILIQLGDNGGIENTGYLCDGFTSAGGAVANLNYTSGFGIGNANQAAASVSHGNFVITNISGNRWVLSGMMGYSNTATISMCSGSKQLSAVLDRIRITTVNGTNTFDAGTINISWEL